MAYGLKYKKNSLFVETSSDSLFADDSFAESKIAHLLLFPGMKSDEEDVKQQIALNHELNHAVQDLSVCSCIVEGQLRDMIRGYLSLVSKFKGIKFPVCAIGNREWNVNVVSENTDYKDIVDNLYLLYDIYESIFLKSYVKPDSPEYKIDTITEWFFHYYDLSVTDLLETYAHHKSYWEQFLIATHLGEDCTTMLHRLVEEVNLYPYHKTDEGFEIDTKFLKYAKPYHIVLAMLTVVSRFDTKALAEYYENSIPADYTSSIAYKMMRLTMCVLETSLSIPSPDIIVKFAKKGYSLDGFSPVHRFYRILKNIYEADGFPDLVDGEDYFITFHNWIAAQNDWLDYETTMTTVFQSLHSRAEVGKEVITNYQMTALSYKFEHMTSYLYSFPLEMLRQVHMPVMVKTSHKLVSLFFLGNRVMNQTGLLRFKDLYFQPCDIDMHYGIVKYQHISDKLPMNDNIKRIKNNSIGAQREVVVRLLAYETLTALTTRGAFVCPMKDGLCPNACEDCESFKSFRDIVPNCHKNIYRGPKDKQVLNDNSGNSIDCMLFDYLLDYGFNPVVFE